MWSCFSNFPRKFQYLVKILSHLIDVISYFQDQEDKNSFVTNFQEKLTHHDHTLSGYNDVILHLHDLCILYLPQTGSRVETKNTDVV